MDYHVRLPINHLSLCDRAPFAYRRSSKSWLRLVFAVYTSHKYSEYLFPLASRQGKWRRLTSIKDHFKQSKQLREKAIFNKLQRRVMAESAEILKASENLIPPEGNGRTRLDSQGWREIT